MSDIVKQAALHSKMKNLHRCIDTAAEFEASVSFDEMVRLVEVCNSRKLEGCGELLTAQTLYSQAHLVEALHHLPCSATAD